MQGAKANLHTHKLAKNFNTGNNALSKSMVAEPTYEEAAVSLTPDGFTYNYGRSRSANPVWPPPDVTEGKRVIYMDLKIVVII